MKLIDTCYNHSIYLQTDDLFSPRLGKSPNVLRAVRRRRIPVNTDFAQTGFSHHSRTVQFS